MGHPQPVSSGQVGNVSCGRSERATGDLPVLTAPMLLMDTWEGERNGRRGGLMWDLGLRILDLLAASLVLGIKGLTEKTGDVFL